MQEENLNSLSRRQYRIIVLEFVFPEDENVDGAGYKDKLLKKSKIFKGLEIFGFKEMPGHYVFILHFYKTINVNHDTHYSLAGPSYLFYSISRKDIIPKFLNDHKIALHRDYDNPEFFFPVYHYGVREEAFTLDDHFKKFMDLDTYTAKVNYIDEHNLQGYADYLYKNTDSYLTMLDLSKKEKLNDSDNIVHKQSNKALLTNNAKLNQRDNFESNKHVICDLSGRRLDLEKELPLNEASESFKAMLKAEAFENFKALDIERLLKPNNREYLESFLNKEYKELFENSKRMKTKLKKLSKMQAFLTLYLGLIDPLFYLYFFDTNRFWSTTYSFHYL